MSYTKRTITDRVSTSDNKFTYTTSGSTITLTPDTSGVINVGTSIDKSFLDVYEDYFYALGTHIDGGNSSSVDGNQDIPNGIIGTTITVRHDSRISWEINNPVLKFGEIGFDLSYNNIKIGDGANAWRSLRYIRNALHSYRLTKDINETKVATQGTTANVNVGHVDSVTLTWLSGTTSSFNVTVNGTITKSLSQANPTVSLSSSELATINTSEFYNGGVSVLHNESGTRVQVQVVGKLYSNAGGIYKSDPTLFSTVNDLITYIMADASKRYCYPNALRSYYRADENKFYIDGESYGTSEWTGIVDTRLGGDNY